MKEIEIIGIGACVADTLITVPRFPKEDTKMRALERKRAGGGPVATGLVAAAKLGRKCSFAGNLANDSDGAFLLADFERYGLDTSLCRIKEGCRSFASSIWLSQESASRTCVFDKGDVPPLALDEEQEKALNSAALLMIDGNEMDGAEAACRLVRRGKTKVLYDCGGLYEGVERLLCLTDIMIPSEEFALAHTGKNTAREAAQALMERYHPEVIVITRGKKGGIGCDSSGFWEYPAFSVEAKDTNGAGDVFHGAFAAAILYGYSYRDCCLYASAVSAIKCTGIGARESVPDHKAVLAFLKERGETPKGKN